MSQCTDWAQEPEPVRLTWERRPSGMGSGSGPSAYFNDQYGYAVFPERGSRKWELCWAAPDSGYEILDWFYTVAAAQRAAAREVARDSIRVLPRSAFRTAIAGSVPGPEGRERVYGLVAAESVMDVAAVRQADMAQLGEGDLLRWFVTALELGAVVRIDSDVPVYLD